MRKILTTCLVAALAACNTAKEETMQQLTERVMQAAVTHYTAMDGVLEADRLPRTTDAEGNLVTSNARWWCSGFYPGTLWYLYEWTGDETLLEAARRNTAKLEQIQYVTNDHDVGFQLNCSYGNGFRLTGDQSYMDVMHTGAHSLATRFNPVIGSLKSWDFVKPGRDWQFPVIIDNMMNLELLMLVARHYGEPELEQVALAHANTTLANHLRDDLSSFHLVDYDPATGEVLMRHTVQGFADDSRWARGQSWALYGFTMMYRFNEDARYLSTAQGIADMLIPALPDDGIPYWDFDSDGIPEDYRDVSAAAIMASALVELSGYTTDTASKKRYLATAEKQLRALASTAYMAEPGTNANFLLRHSVGSIPDNSEIDVPLTYADYYFIEALHRFAKL